MTSKQAIVEFCKTLSTIYEEHSDRIFSEECPCFCSRNSCKTDAEEASVPDQFVRYVQQAVKEKLHRDGMETGDL